MKYGKMTVKKTSKPLTREQWLEKALDVLSAAGGAKLRIDKLVDQLGVTKGSFYWHFKNREDFVHQVIDYWHENYTLVVSDSLDQGGGSAEEKLRQLLDMVFVKRLTKYDLAIRSWAIGEKKLQPLVNRSDKHRLKYLRMLFSGIGFDKDGADIRARVLLGEASWEAALFEKMTKSQRKKKARELYELLTK